MWILGLKGELFVTRTIALLVGKLISIGVK